MKNVTFFNGEYNETIQGNLKKTGVDRYVLTTEEGWGIDLHKGDIVWAKDKAFADKYLKLQEKELELQDTLDESRWSICQSKVDALEIRIERVQKRLSELEIDVDEKVFELLGDQCCTYEEFKENIIY